jgi:hypothetical protein
MVYRALLLAANIAIKSLGPGQRRHPILRWDFLHEGSLHQMQVQPAIFVLRSGRAEQL